MNEQENAVAQQPEQEVEELEIQVTDQPTDTAEPVASSDDELDNYTKSVSKRINKLNERHRAAEEKAARLEAQLRQKEQENAAYVQNNLQTRAALIQKDGKYTVEKASMSRSARIIMDGNVHVPAGTMD